MTHPNPPVPAVTLIGPRGAGKTTVGRLVADRLGLPFIDLDARIEHAAGRTVAEIFLSEAEAGFRRREAETLRRAASEACVLATGGGVVVLADNRRLLLALPTPRVWLAGDPDTFARRTLADTAGVRPALTSLDPLAEARHLADARGPLYGEVATHTLDALRDPEAVAADIIAVVHAERT